MSSVRVRSLAAAAVFAGCFGSIGSAAAQSPPATQKETRVLCVHDIEPPDGLNVHANPTKAAPVTGRFPAKACGIKLIGTCVEDWCEMTLGTLTGWVDSRFVAYYDVPAGYPVVDTPEPKRTATPVVKAAETPPERLPTPTRKTRKASETQKKLAQQRKSAMKPSREAKARARQLHPARIATAYDSHPMHRIQWHFAERHGASMSSGFSSYVASAFGSATRFLLGGPATAHSYAEAQTSRSSARTGCVRRVAFNDVLHVRTGPGPANSAVGAIPPTACGVTRTGACHGPWCRIAWRGRSGWVNTYYID